MNTLRRAEEIRMDKARHNAAKKLVTQHLKTLHKVRGK